MLDRRWCADLAFLTCPEMCPEMPTFACLPTSSGTPWPCKIRGMHGPLPFLTSPTAGGRVCASAKGPRLGYIDTCSSCPKRRTKHACVFESSPFGGIGMKWNWIRSLSRVISQPPVAVSIALSSTWRPYQIWLARRSHWSSATICSHEELYRTQEDPMWHRIRAAATVAESGNNPVAFPGPVYSSVTSRTLGRAFPSPSKAAANARRPQPSPALFAAASSRERSAPLEGLRPLFREQKN